MDFLSESDFEIFVRNHIIRHSIPNSEDYKLFNFKKAVDILISYEGNVPTLFFIEIKYHKKIHGRLGFGQSQGNGFQPEVLSLRPKFFEKNMRWILGKEGSDMYWLLTNDELCNYVSGGEIGKKHNNIQSKIFSLVKPINRVELIIALKAWLSNV